MVERCILSYLSKRSLLVTCSFVTYPVSPGDAAVSPSVVDNKLNFEPFVDAVFKNAHQRINFYQKLRSFNVDTTFLKMFYSCFIEYVLTFCSAGTGHFL